MGELEEESGEGWNATQAFTPMQDRLASRSVEGWSPAPAGPGFRIYADPDPMDKTPVTIGEGSLSVTTSSCEEGPALKKA